MPVWQCYGLLKTVVMYHVLKLCPYVSQPWAEEVEACLSHRGICCGSWRRSCIRWTARRRRRRSSSAGRWGTLASFRRLREVCPLPSSEGGHCTDHIPRLCAKRNNNRWKLDAQKQCRPSPLQLPAALTSIKEAAPPFLKSPNPSYPASFHSCRPQTSITQALLNWGHPSPQLIS